MGAEGIHWSGLWALRGALHAIFLGVVEWIQSPAGCLAVLMAYQPSHKLARMLAFEQTEEGF
jgi:hypothetical protein